MMDVIILRKRVSVIRHVGGFDFLTVDFEIEGREDLGTRVFQTPISEGLEDPRLPTTVLAGVKEEARRCLQADADARTAARVVLKDVKRWVMSVELTGGQ